MHWHISLDKETFVTIEVIIMQYNVYIYVYIYTFIRSIVYIKIHIYAILPNKRTIDIIDLIKIN